MPDDLTTARSQGSVRGSQVENVSSLVAGEGEEPVPVLRKRLKSNGRGKLVFAAQLCRREVKDLQLAGGVGNCKRSGGGAEVCVIAEEVPFLFSAGKRVQKNAVAFEQ